MRIVITEPRKMKIEHKTCMQAEEMLQNGISEDMQDILEM